MSDIIQGFILTFIEASCCSIFFDTFLPLRFPKNRWMNQTVVAIMTIVFTTIAILLAEQQILKVVAAFGVVAIAMFILYRCHVRQVLFFSIAYYGIVLAIDLGLWTVLQYVLVEDLDQMMDPVKAMVLAILFKAVLFLCIIVIRRKFLRKFPYELPEDYEWVLFLFFPLFTVAAMLFFFVDGGGGGRAVLLVSFGLVIANLILFYMLREFAAKARKAQETSLMQERAKNQMELYESMDASYNEQKSRVHEFKNHVGCIQGLLMDGKEEEALSYANRINDEIEFHMNLLDTANPIVNAVISQKYRQAKKEGTAMSLSLDRLDGIRISDEDLVVMLSNLLDNAIEACRELKEEERLIRLRFVQEEKKFIIATKNPVKSQVKILDGMIATTKENKGQHGIGISNIKKVVEKYGGEDVLSCNNGFFYYTLIFQKQMIKGG